MKHLKPISICCVLAISFILHSCSSVDKNALPVPKDASMVMHINTKSLTSKLSWEEIRQTNWFSRFDTSTTDSFAKQILQNPENSGIDIKDELVLFTRRVGEMGSYFAIAGRLKDAAAFEAFNRKLSTKNTAPTKEGELNYISLDEKVMVSWKGNKFIYLLNAGNSYPINSDMDSRFGDDSARKAMPLAPMDLKASVKNLFNLDSDSLLADDSRYTSLIKENGDMHLWVNAESSYEGALPREMNFLSRFSIDKYLKETVTATTLNFDNGKIVMHAKTYSNDEMTKLFKKYEGDKLNNNFLQRLPSDNVAAVLVMNYKPEGIREFLRLGNLDGMVNAFLADAGLSLDDFIAANKGDVMIAVTDFKFKDVIIDLGEDVEKIPTRKAEMDFIFATSIGNKAAFDKLVSTGKRIMERGMRDTSVFYNMNNELFVLSNKQQSVDQFLKGGNRNLPFASKINDHPIGGYVDLQKFFSVFVTEPGDSANVQRHAISQAMWQDIVMTGGEFKDDGLVQNIEVNLVDKNTNSLKQLSQYADRMSMVGKRGF